MTGCRAPHLSTRIIDNNNVHRYNLTAHRIECECGLCIYIYDVDALPTIVL